MFGIDKVVLFDFDGVIVDTLEFSLALNRTINPLLTKETYQSFFDGNIYEVEDSHSDTYTWIGDDQWYPLYSKHIMEKPHVSGMEKFIEDLSRSFPLAIVSSTISAPIDDYLRKYDLATSFSRTM